MPFWLFMQSEESVTAAPPEMFMVAVTSFVVWPVPREMQNQPPSCLTSPPTMSNCTDFCVRVPIQSMSESRFVCPSPPRITRPSLIVKTA